MTTSPAAQGLAGRADDVRDVEDEVDRVAGRLGGVAGGGGLVAVLERAGGDAGRARALDQRAEQDVALEDVGGEDRLGVGGVRVEVDELDRDAEPGDRRLGLRARGARGEVGAHVHRDLGLELRVAPAVERDGPAVGDPRRREQIAHERRVGAELGHRGRHAHAELPAQRRLAGLDAPAALGQLREHPALDPRVPCHGGDSATARARRGPGAVTERRGSGSRPRRGGSRRRGRGRPRRRGRR